MTQNSDKKQPSITVIGKTVLVEKEKIDCGGLKLSPGAEQDGMKNEGRVLEVGTISEKLRMKGLKKGAIIYFKKHFIANMDSENELVFVKTEDILGIKK